MTFFLKSYPKLTLIYGGIVGSIIFFFGILEAGFSGYSVGYATGSAIGILLIPTIAAGLFWFILGKKEHGGTTTFNIVLTLLVLSRISNFSQETINKQKPINDLKNAVSEYQKGNLENPDSVEANYAALSDYMKDGLNDLIRTSTGDEKQVYLFLNDHFLVTDSLNMEWSNSYNAILDTRILNYKILETKREYRFQQEVVQEFVEISIEYESFIKNRVESVISATKHLNHNSKAVKGFMKGLREVDSVQTPILLPLLKAQIAYGQSLNEILELLEKEDGKWKLENETPRFQNSKSQVMYEELLDTAIKQEETVNRLADKKAPLL